MAQKERSTETCQKVDILYGARTGIRSSDAAGGNHASPEWNAEYGPLRTSTGPRTRTTYYLPKASYYAGQKHCKACSLMGLRSNTGVVEPCGIADRPLLSRILTCVASLLFCLSSLSFGTVICLIEYCNLFYTSRVIRGKGIIAVSQSANPRISCPS